MKQNLGRLIRYFLIINKLSGVNKFVPVDELLQYLSGKMKDRGYETSISQRTLQRDFKEIKDLFSIEIKSRRDYGYFIEYKDNDPDIRYNEILMDFDLITAINPEIRSLGFILPEHHRPKGSDAIPLLINAIKERSRISFDYILYRKDNKIIRPTVNPYFLKESLGLWYLIGIDDSGKLKYYGIDRIVNPSVLDEKFTADESLDADNLFKYSYGIWDDPDMPVEHIVLSYSQLDGSFIKAKPLHHTQKILVDTQDEFRISVDLRVTNDFVMELLSRSKSLEVISPLSLRKRIHEIAEQCSKRNS